MRRRETFYLQFLELTTKAATGVTIPSDTAYAKGDVIVYKKTAYFTTCASIFDHQKAAA